MTTQTPTSTEIQRARKAYVQAKFKGWSLWQEAKTNLFVAHPDSELRDIETRRPKLLRAARKEMKQAAEFYSQAADLLDSYLKMTEGKQRWLRYVPTILRARSSWLKAKAKALVIS